MYLTEGPLEFEALLTSRDLIVGCNMPIRIRCLDKLPGTLKHVHSKGDAMGNIVTLEEGYTANTRNSAAYADQPNYCWAIPRIYKYDISYS